MAIRKCVTVGGSLLAVASGFAVAAPATVRNEAVLRAGPGASFSVIGHVPAGTKMEMGDCTAGWCQVDFNGIVGFVGAADLGTTGRFQISPRSRAENVQTRRTRASRKSAPASSSTDPPR